MRPQVRAVARGLRPLRRTVRRLRSEEPLTLIGWHRIDDRHTDGLSTSETAFEQHLDLLEERDARVLPLCEAVERLALGSLPPRAVALTFDDGYASVVETAWPLLRKRDMPATLFVCSEYLPGTQRFDWDTTEPVHERHRVATAEQIVDAHAEGLDIGSHTRTHPWLPALDDEALAHELLESREVLEDLVRVPVRTLAYPTGGWDRRVRAAAARAGYTAAVTVSKGTNRRRTHPLSLHRAFVPEEVDDLDLLLDGAYGFLRPVDAVRRPREAP
ncbi:polysaccharide deacetylase family protein [Nocardioides marinus]|uniref:Peptidoglycan/xylan/chitin deacetylase (PgdA/CDA1 family) n=1 Tax=Nocardioides marinus TaxID=374514 RepID=A0A7Y9YEC1_9ACTN|nr:polysaccharide deacetylase family protein [Nocardioides marinus]NYI09702.1 peptidoglycan/xylan/chitin deacetylase (PgdA/CDA1 family) [Nocardioides marinus]